MKTDSELTIQARAIARRLSYNEDQAQAEAKHILLELAHRLDTRCVRVSKSPIGDMLVNGTGKSRFMTLLERFMYRMFGVVPMKV